LGAAARFGELKTLFPKGLGSCTHKIFACGAVLKLILLNSITHTETTIKFTLISHGVAIKFSKNKEKKHFNYPMRWNVQKWRFRRRRRRNFFGVL